MFDLHVFLFLCKYTYLNASKHAIKYQLHNLIVRVHPNYDNYKGPIQNIFSVFYLFGTTYTNLIRYLQCLVLYFYNTWHTR